MLKIDALNSWFFDWRDGLAIKGHRSLSRLRILNPHLDFHAQ